MLAIRLTEGVNIRRNIIILMSGIRYYPGKNKAGIEAKIIAPTAKSNWSTTQKGAPLFMLNLLLRNDPAKSPNAAPYEQKIILKASINIPIGKGPPIK